MTFLSAQKAGFKGSYDDWVEAGRPESGEGIANPQYSVPGLNDFDWKSPLMKGSINEILKATQNAIARAQTKIGQPSLFNPDKVYSAEDFTDEVVMRFNNLIGQAISDQRVSAGTQEQLQHDLDMAMNVFVPAFKAQVDPANAEKYNEEAEQGAKAIESGTVGAGQESPYGLNPRTGEPFESLPQAFAFARQDPDNKGMTWEEFKQEPTPFLERADIEGVPTREPSMERPGEGTIAEQNKTGMPYPTWAAQQRAAGKPSSYQDWLSASAPPKEQPEAGVAEGVQAGQADGAPVTVGQDDNMTLALQQIDAALANGLLDQDTATLFKTVVRNWDVDKELNMDNVLQEFDEISKSTISPYFAEQADIFKKDLQSAVSNLEESRAEELEAQGIRQEEKIRGTREDLARRGLTFSEEAARKLGGKSAFGEKVPFGGERQLGEGLVPTEGRLIASGSQRSYQQAIDALGRQAETALGKEGVGSLVPGFAPRGVTQGSIAQKKQEAEANILSGLAGQERQLKEYQKPLDYNFTT